MDGSIPDELADAVLGEWRAAHRDDARALRYLACFRGDNYFVDEKSVRDGRRLDDGQSFFMRLTLPRRNFSWRAHLP